jgi:hypothetical protein
MWATSTMSAVVSQRLSGVLPISKLIAIYADEMFQTPPIPPGSVCNL